MVSFWHRNIHLKSFNSLSCRIIFFHFIFFHSFFDNPLIFAKHHLFLKSTRLCHWILGSTFSMLHFESSSFDEAASSVQMAIGGAHPRAAWRGCHASRTLHTAVGVSSNKCRRRRCGRFHSQLLLPRRSRTTSSWCARNVVSSIGGSLARNLWT